MLKTVVLINISMETLFFHNEKVQRTAFIKKKKKKKKLHHKMSVPLDKFKASLLKKIYFLTSNIW